MLLMFLCLGILHVEGQLLHKSAAHFALFGKINSLDDLFLPEEVEVDESEANITMAELRDLLDDSVQIGNITDYFTINNINKSKVLRDERDFNDINLKMYKSTRKRFYSAGWINYIAKYDPEDNATWAQEIVKIKMLQDFALQFLLHSRKKIEGAFGQREKIRDDKRYKLGYLFNRLRRIKTEMNKILYQTDRFEKGKFVVEEMRRLNGMMRYYERIVRLDVDVRDTCQLIRVIYNTLAPFDVEKKQQVPAGAMPTDDGKKVETAESWGSEAIVFVRDIGRRLRDRGFDYRSGSFLVQRLAVAIQRGNAASILGSFAPGAIRGGLFD